MNRVERAAEQAEALDRHFAGQRWAWAQHVPPEEKLILLALLDGEADIAALERRCCIGPHTSAICLERLRERELIDENNRPKVP